MSIAINRILISHVLNGVTKVLLHFLDFLKPEELQIQ